MFRRNQCPYTDTNIINMIPWGEVGWVWSPEEADQEGGGMMEVRYDVVRDRYFTTNTEGVGREEWWRGVWRWQNIQRRENWDRQSRQTSVCLAREDVDKPGLVKVVVVVMVVRMGWEP